MSNNLSYINSLEKLKHEQVRVRTRLEVQEKEFKKKFQQLPGELAAAGANNFIPRFLRGKVTDTALNGGKFLINKLFVTPDEGGQNIITKTKKSGVVPFVKTVFKMIKGK